MKITIVFYSGKKGKVNGWHYSRFNVCLLVLENHSIFLKSKNGNYRFSNWIWQIYLLLFVYSAYVFWNPTSFCFINFSYHNLFLNLYTNVFYFKMLESKFRPSTYEICTLKVALFQFACLFTTIAGNYDSKFCSGNDDSIRKLIVWMELYIKCV